MKQILTPKSLLSALLGIAIITSCKKSNNITAVKPTILVSKIIDDSPNTQFHASFGKPLVEFTYSGKQLVKTLNYIYINSTTPAYIETDLFNYDSGGVFTGTTVSYSTSPNNNILSTSVTYNGNHIAEIIMNRRDGLTNDTKLSYQNGMLATAEYINNNTPVSADNTYTFGYDFSNHNSLTTYDTGPEGHTIISTAFDNHPNLHGAFPLWEFFYAGGNINFHGPELLSNLFCGTPGANNPLNVTVNGSSAVFYYLYNSNGYPSTVSYTETDNTGLDIFVSYKFQYIQIK